MSDTVTTAEISEMLNLRTGATMWGFTIWTDRKPRKNGGLTKGKRAGPIIEDDLPHLLHRVGLYIEQEGSLEAVADSIRGAVARG